MLCPAQTGEGVPQADMLPNNNLGRSDSNSCAVRSRGLATGSNSRCADFVRAASLLRADMIFGKDKWLMKNDFAPVVGHRFNLRGDWGGVLDCEVLAVEPNKTLSYTWNFAHDDAAYNLKSVVTFTLTPTRTGTHLRMERVGFRPDQKQAYGGARAGWQQFFAKLEQVWRGQTEVRRVAFRLVFRGGPVELE